MSKDVFPTVPIARLSATDGSAVHCVTFSSGTGQYIVSGHQDRAIRLFNPSTQRLIQTYRGHGHEVLDVSVSADNARLASAGGDKTVFVWDVATAQTVRRLSGHAARVHAVAFGGDDDAVIVSGSFDGTVKLWDTKAGRGGDHRPIMTLGEATDAVAAVAVRAHEVYVAAVDGRVRVYDLAAGHVDVDVIAPGHGATAVSPTQAADAYLVSSLDGALRLIDRPTGACLQTFRADGFRNDSYRLRSTLAMADAVALSGSEDGSVWAWDVLSGQVKHQLWHGADAAAAAAGAPATKKTVVSAVAWNQLRRQWASAGGDGSVVVWGLGE